MRSLNVLPGSEFSRFLSTQFKPAVTYDNRRLPIKTRPTAGGWMVAGFLAVLDHGTHIVSKELGSHGALMHRSMRGSLKGGLFPQPLGYLNVQALWMQWKNLCYLLLSLKLQQASIVPVVDQELNALANCVGWGMWQGSQVSWRAVTLGLFNSLNLPVSHHSSVCVLYLKTTQPRLKNLGWWFKYPVFGLFLPPHFIGGWAGIVSTRSHITLQYFLLGWVWMSAHSRA